MATMVVTEQEAAQILSVSVRTLQGWRWRGDGPPFVKISRRCVRYRIDDLNAWLEDRIQTRTDGL